MWRRGEEPPLDRETVNDIIVMLMRIEAKVDRVLTRMEDDDDEEDRADA